MSARKDRAGAQGRYASAALAEQFRAEQEKRMRRLVTPEGIELNLRLGDAGERAAAFIIDFLIQILILVAMTLAVAFTVNPFNSDVGGELMMIIWLLGAFALRNFYFIAFELGPKAATPGKRVMGLRVAARNGGRLTSEMVFARNAMREIEVFLPLSFTAPGTGVDGWISLAGFVWGMIFLLFPLFNKDRLRAGDMIAGTWVMKTPRQKLLEDIAAQGEAQLAKGLAFSREELGVYGVHELHVLENVLRLSRKEAVTEVAAQIRQKIGRDRDKDFAERDFLAAYYAALRRHLEGQLVMGVRRKDKHDTAG